MSELDPEDPITWIQPGEPYSEEVRDPELAKFNQLTARFAFAALAEHRAWEALANSGEHDEEQCRAEWVRAAEAQELALAEFVEFMSKQGPDTMGPGSEA